MVSFEKEGRWRDVSIREDFGRRLSIEGFKTVYVEDRVADRVVRVGVRCLNRLMLLLIFSTQLANLVLKTNVRV